MIHQCRCCDAVEVDILKQSLRDYNDAATLGIACCIAEAKSCGSTFFSDFSIFEKHLFDVKVLYTYD